MRDNRKSRVCIKASMIITTWFYKIIKKITKGRRPNSKEERKSKIIRLGEIRDSEVKLGSGKFMESSGM